MLKISLHAILFQAVIWQKTKVLDHKMAFMSVVGTAVMGSMVPFQHHCKDPEVSF